MFNGIFCEFRFSLPPSFLFRLPFLSRKQRKQKKVDRRKVVFLRLRRSRQRAAQNGQLACERPFFVPRRMCEKRLFYACYPQPLCLLFLFFKKRNRSPSFLFRRKEAKESHLRNVYFPLLLTVSPTCSTKRTAHIRAGRFFCCKLDVRENAFCSKCPLSRFVFCFFSSRKEIVPLLFFLEEKKSFPKRNRTPSKLHEKAGRSF